MAKKEIWKDTAHSALHEVSSSGQVRNKKTMRILKPAGRTGYVFVQLKNRGKSWNIHRLVAEAFLPNQSNLPFVNHKNGIKSDNRIENLEWVTASQNKKHSVEVLGMGRGEHHGMSRFTDADVLDMRRLWGEGVESKVIAMSHETSVAQIHAICKGKIWRHLPVTPRPDRFRAKKLCHQDAIEIRKMAESGETGTSIARIFNIDPSTVSKVVKNKIFRAKGSHQWPAL